MTEEMRKLRRPDGASIAYGIARGAAPRPLLVLIHGMASNMTRWSEFVEQTTLTRSWDLMRLDLRGHAGSLWRGRIGMEIWCDDLAAILDAEGYERAVVGGHCLGANLALHFAQRHAQRAQGLVLIEPMPPEAQTGIMRRMQRLAPLLKLATRAVLVMNRIGIRRRRLEQLDLKQLDKATRTTMAAQGNPDAMARQYASPLLDLRSMPTAVYLQDLVQVGLPLPPFAALRAPVLALTASGTGFTDPARVEEMLTAIPQLTLKRLDALHWIPTEQPLAMRLAIEQWCGNIARQYQGS
jgi:pimeloyl-ACP methyl ester carboxylesterase